MNALTGATTTVAGTVEIEAMRAEIDRMRTALVAERSKAVTAMETLSKRLHEKADEHNFCEAYDEVIDEVNRALPDGFPRLDRRTRTWTVKGTYTVIIEREIEATTEAEALDDFASEVERDLDSMKENGDLDEYTLEESSAEIES